MVFNEALVKQGFLEKRGHGILVSWTTRWFILTNSTLAYFTDQTLSYKKGEYVLDNTYSLDTQASDEAHEFLFCLRRNGKLELLISAPNLSTMQAWEEALNKVISAIKVKNPNVLKTPARRSSAMPILNYVRESFQTPPTSHSAASSQRVAKPQSLRCTTRFLEIGLFV